MTKPSKPTGLYGSRTSRQSQIPYAPIVSSLPLLNDPQSQNGSLVVLSSGNPIIDGLYSFTSSPLPGSWTQVSASNNYVLAGYNSTPVTVNANTTSEQNLMSVVLPDNILNQVGKVFRITSKGVYVVNAAGTDFTVRTYINSTAISDHVLTLNPTGTLVELGWRSVVEFIVTTNGALGNIETSWWGIAQVSTSTNPGESTVDSRVSTLNLDTTGTPTIQIKCLFSVASINNACSQRILLVEKLN